jgi:AcrR family transcriptional regulator
MRMAGIEQAAASPAATARVDEILRAACRVVVSGGASDLRIGSVAQEAGVSRTLVHYYFTTRQELLRATFAYAEDLRIVALEAELATLSTGAERAERALFRTIDPELEETPALWNEVWSSLRYDEELHPLVQDRYRAWIDRIVRLLDEGREDGSVPRSVDPVGAGWRLAAAADGLDSIHYLGLVGRDEARELLASCVRRELAQ